MTGRYDGVEIAETDVDDGAGRLRTVRYLRRRAVPAPPTLPPIALHRVVDGDRLDNVTARYLGDPLAFWRVADAAAVLDADDLTATIGEVITIPTPES